MSTKHITLSLTQVIPGSSITLLFSLHLHFQQVVQDKIWLSSLLVLFCYYWSYAHNNHALGNLPPKNHLPQIISPLSHGCYPPHFCPPVHCLCSLSMQSHRGIPLPECFGGSLLPSSFSWALPTSPASFLASSHTLHTFWSYLGRPIVDCPEKNNTCKCKSVLLMMILGQ